MTGRKIILVLAVILLTAAASGAQSLEPQPPAAAVEAPTLETPVEAGEPELPVDLSLDWIALTCTSDCYELWEHCFDGCDISPYPNCYHDCRMSRGQCLLGCP